MSLAVRENQALNPQCRSNTTGWTAYGTGTESRVTDDGDEASTCFQVANAGSASIVRAYIHQNTSAVPVKEGQWVAAFGSFKVVSSDQQVTEGRFQRLLYNTETGAAIGTGAWGVQEVNGPVIIADPTHGEWHRMLWVFQIPAGIPANTGVAIATRTSKVNGTSATVRFGRMGIIVGNVLGLTTDDWFDGDSLGASWSGTPNASTSHLVVPAYDPRLGAFREGTQAVRVYWPEGGSSGDAHALTINPWTDDFGAALTHVWTDDPGSVGKDVRLHWQWRGESGLISTVNSTVTLTASPTPLPLTGGPLPDGADRVRLDVRRADGNTAETNLLYSASQVSPHSIERYRDERSHGHELVDPDAYWKGSRSLEAPIEYDASARLYIPATRLRLNNGIN